MKFEEMDYLELTNIPEIFIYFLLDDDEVVYIGKTIQGLTRCYIHKKDKIFNRVMVIPCEQDDLDYLESIFIIKYNPKYNKMPNLTGLVTVSKVVTMLNRDRITKKMMNTNKLFKLFENINISPVLYNGKFYISDYQVDIVMDYLRRN